jgi:Ni/Co efflux regulator RcnB
MKKLLLALIAAGFASATVAYAADDQQPYTAKPKVEKPGRAADNTTGGTDSSTVKQGGPSTKPGRAADENGNKKKKKKKDQSQPQPKQQQ